MAVEVDIAKYTHKSMGEPPAPWATITVRSTDGAQHPSLPFQEAGSLFEDRDGDTWRIKSATVVENDYAGGDVAGVDALYSWRYLAELVIDTGRRRGTLPAG